MGQKVHPLGFRIAITETWRSRWFADKKTFSVYVIEDYKIRKFVKKNYSQAGVERIEIERPGENDRDIKLTIRVARVGLLVGRRGERIEQMQEDLEKLTGKSFQVRLIEVQEPAISAQLVSEDIATQLQKRQSFRRAMKRAADAAIDAGAKGIKMLISGRVGGAEIARREKLIRGSIPLHTLQAHVDYGFTEAPTPYGNIGIKVWIYRGRNDEESIDGANAQKGQVSKGPKRKIKR